MSTIQRTLARYNDVLGSTEKWQENLSSRFAITIVVGFTLGMLLGFWSLLQTAAAFKKALKVRGGREDRKEYRECDVKY